MIGPVKKNQSPYRQNLQAMARMANYEPVASIQQPSQGFNYTMARNRYSDYYQIPRVVRKSNEDMKLATILQTHGRSPLFPKIGKGKHDKSKDHLDASRKKIKGLRSYFKRDHDTTANSREGSLTIDTRLETEEDHGAQHSSSFDQMGVNYDHPLILGSFTAERERLQSNSSQISSILSRKRYRSPEALHQSLISAMPGGFVQEEEEEDSEDEEEFVRNSMPGPGSYDCCNSDFDKTRNTRSTNVSFLSKNSRFGYGTESKGIREVSKDEKKSQSVKHEKEVRRRPKKEIPFNCKSPRKLHDIASPKNQVPGPEDYYPRQGIEEELIKSIQRNFKGSFGSNKPRFVYQNPEYPELGPGTYQNAAETDLLSNPDFYFKSKKTRFG